MDFIFSLGDLLIITPFTNALLLIYALVGNFGLPLYSRKR